MAGFMSRIADLQADFQRIADRAPWVRAAFTLRAGRFGMFGFGRPGGDGDREAILISDPGPVLSELHGLTQQAGLLLAEMLQAGCYKGKGFSLNPVSCPRERSWEVWLVFLLHSPLTLGYCLTKAPDGTKRFAVSQLGESEVAVEIDRYPEVCLAALACLIGEEGNDDNAELIPASTAAELFNVTIPQISKWHRSGKVRGRPPTDEEKRGKVRLLVSKPDVEQAVLQMRQRKGP